ncbi:MAG: hypothetical protein V3T72_13865, partial [Thermoanaerobaculia bacterium]
KDGSEKEFADVGRKSQALENNIAEALRSGVSVKVIEQQLGFSLPTLNTRTESYGSRTVRARAMSRPGVSSTG